MNRPSDFQQLVDRDLSSLQWNEWRKQQVFCAMDEERRTPYMKKKMTSILAFALTLCLLAGVALAATLVYSNHYTQAEKADALLKEHFNITEDKLSFFTRSSEGDIYHYESLNDFAGMLGDYEVNLSTGEVNWLYGGTEGTGWDAQKLDEILALCQQPDGYRQAVRKAKAAAADLGLTMLPAEPVDADKAIRDAESRLAETTENAIIAQSRATISMDEAKDLALAAIQQKYGLTDAQMKQLEFVDESSMYTMDGETPHIEPYFWLCQQEDAFTEKDGIYVVVINALDGTIEGIRYDTALLGNG